jgi:uncharacterized protein YacL
MTNHHRTHGLQAQIDELATWEIVTIIAGIIGLVVALILSWPALVQLAPAL